MIKNYFKTVSRNLWEAEFRRHQCGRTGRRHRRVPAIFLIIQFELSFDDFHPNKKQDLPCSISGITAMANTKRAGVPYPVPTALHTDFFQTCPARLCIRTATQIVLPDDSGRNPEEVQGREWCVLR